MVLFLLSKKSHFGGLGWPGALIGSRRLLRSPLVPVLNRSRQTVVASDGLNCRHRFVVDWILVGHRLRHEAQDSNPYR
jgi:hypothetical protein